MSTFFDILDKHFDCLVDYREFLCYFFAMDAHSVEVKLRKSFQLYMSLEGEISLQQLWIILRVSGDDIEQEKIARLLCQALDQLTQTKKYDYARTDIEILLTSCSSQFDWNQLVRVSTKSKYGY